MKPQPILQSTVTGSLLLAPHQIWPLAPFASLHVEFEADEPVAADHPLTILQTTVGLLPDVR